jgi:putative iron-regulated protein
MKRAVRLAILAVATALVGIGAIMLARNPAAKQYLADRTFHRVLADYTENTVLKTIGLAVADIRALDAAVKRLQADPTDENMVKAADAWRIARARWKQTAVFEFGPSAYYNFDKQLSAWPLDRPLVDHRLSEIAAGRLQMDESCLRERINASQRGFLAAEYLLFRNGRSRRATEVSSAELSYLAAVTEAMVVESIDYEAAWAGTANLSADKAAILEQAGLKSRTSFAAEFKHPGRPGSRYASVSIPLQEIFQDSIAVVEEMCPAIGEVFLSGEPRDSETWYSYNASADFLNLLQGVENAYLGGVESARGHSVSELVAAQSEALDRRIRIALADTAYRISALGDPYDKDREGRELAVRIAESACGKLLSRLTAAQPLVCMDPSTRPWAAYGR